MLIHALAFLCDNIDGAEVVSLVASLAAVGALVTSYAVGAAGKAEFLRKICIEAPDIFALIQAFAKHNA